MIRVSIFSLIVIACLIILGLAAPARAANQRAVSFGNTLPATCYPGDLFFKMNATAGSNVFACVAQNTWVVQGTSALGGDLSGTATAATVTQVQGRPVASTAPQGGQSLTWNSGTSRWEPQTIAGGSGGSTTLSGDVVGASSATTVQQIQGHPVASTTPTTGQALLWNGATSRWEPQTISSGTGGGGTGASMASQLGDLAVSLTSSTVLTIGPNCSFTTPCNVRFGASGYSLTSAFTAAISGGSGNAYIYLASSGALTVGHSMTVVCSGSCTSASGVIAFPPDSIPLFLWHATNGAWDSSGSDQRAFLASKDVIPGTGMISTELSGHTSISADPTVIGLRASVPGTSGTACTAGAWATDGTYYYLCVNQNSWRRAALSSW